MNIQQTGRAVLIGSTWHFARVPLDAPARATDPGGILA
jgi:hypothetical protein